MRAVVFDECGEPEQVIECREIAPPGVAAGELLVRMLASPINPSDVMFIRGVYGPQPQIPAIPGFEGVGIVERSGGGMLGRLLIGRRVCVLSPKGGRVDLTVSDARTR